MMEAGKVLAKRVAASASCWGAEGTEACTAIAGRPTAEWQMPQAEQLAPCAALSLQ